MKNTLSRSFQLLFSIALGTAVSWVSLYSFWFAVWTFHSVDVARAADAVGQFILIPGYYIFEWLGGDQSAIFYNPNAFSGTNGLVIGIVIYSILRATLHIKQLRREKQSGAVAHNGTAPASKPTPQPAGQKVS